MLMMLTIKLNSVLCIFGPVSSSLFIALCSCWAVVLFAEELHNILRCVFSHLPPPTKNSINKETCSLRVSAGVSSSCR